MNKPEVRTIPITQIEIEDRVREEFDQEALDILAQSIRENGLLHYPVVTPIEGEDSKYKLIAGERRIRALKQLEWEEVPVSIRQNTSPLRLKVLELEENIARAGLTWQEEVKAKHQIHTLKTLEEDEWTLKDTAKLLNKSEGDIVQDINLARALIDKPELEKHKNKTDAYKETKQEKENQLRAELARRLREEGYGEDYILCADCTEIIPELEEGQVDLIVTDPPWGTEVETSETVTPEYDDSEEYMREIVKNAYNQMYRVLREGGHGYVFFGIQYMDWHISQLTKAGFEVDLIPGFWDKGSPGGMYSPGRESNQYEPYLHFWKGEPEPLKGKPGNVKDAKRVSPEEKIHSAEKPIEMWEQLIEPATEPGDLVVDFFAGSASSLRAALLLDRRVFGCEVDEVIHQKAVERIEQTIAEEMSRENSNFEDGEDSK